MCSNTLLNETTAKHEEDINSANGCDEVGINGMSDAKDESRANPWNLNGPHHIFETKGLYRMIRIYDNASVERLERTVCLK
jgi:hypothetical protein